jgi:membrane associated rhomboid family serine protease
MSANKDEDEADEAQTGAFMRTYLGSAAIVCVMAGMFLLELARSAVGNDALLVGLGALPDSGQIDHEYWRLLTAGFLHYDLTHFALNTLLLFLVGPVVERRAGTVWLLLIFLGGSLASFAGILMKHLYWPSSGVSLGASGGLFTLLGTGLVLVSRLPSESRRVRIRLLVPLVLGLAYSVLPNVTMTGHIVGLVVGAAIALALPLPAASPVVPAARDLNSR